MKKCKRFVEQTINIYQEKPNPKHGSTARVGIKTQDTSVTNGSVIFDVCLLQRKLPNSLKKWRQK